METKIEIWKVVKDYPDYQVSSMGRVKSLKYNKEKILKPAISNGYLAVVLLNERKQTKRIHQLIAESFFGHVPNGNTLVVNHINFNKQDNQLENLEIITNRQNSNRKHLKSSSIFTGVSWDKMAKKWKSEIKFKGKTHYLGRFNNEIEASNAYEKALLEVNDMDFNIKTFSKNKH